MEVGTVVKSTGSWYNVRLDAPESPIWPCRIVGKFRLENMSVTNPVAVGDRVELVQEGQPGQGMIRKILPRKNYVARQSPRKKHDVHLLAANVDQAVLLVTIIEPMLKPGFIDRFLLMTEPRDIPFVLVMNKCDLWKDAEWAVFEEFRSVYTKIGYTVLATSTETRQGLEEFTEVLKGKISLLGGQSGVGKSSLVNSIQSKFELRTGEISDYSGKGQHTTTFAEMFDLEFGGHIIDTPGMKVLSFNFLTPLNIAQNYREFFKLSEFCRFGGTCMHRNEPNCAVIAAVEKSEVSPLRYQNYLTILEEIEDQDFWDRNREF
jgi:ribosome biogenesis GTPase / thiamine phosphate phosphatase